MNDTLIAQIQSFTLDARHKLEREVCEQLEGIYGWMPDGSFAKAGLYPAANQIEEARETRRGLEAYAVEEKEAGFTSSASRQKLVRETAFTWLNRFIALRMMEERRLVKSAVSRLFESNAYLFWLADEKDPEARKLHEHGETPVNPMGEGPRHIAYRRFLLWQCGELARDVSVLFDPETLASHLCPRPNVLKELVAAMMGDGLVEAWKPGNEETIGWIYSAFISEEKKATFAAFQKGKKVRPEQIAPATQVFTPRWVVRYLVENSLGRLWLDMHPDSRLKDSLAYLVPLEITGQPSLKRAREITFLDPATGSMHFGLVAFDLFVEMYREEIEKAGNPGWSEKPSVESQEDIPSAIIAYNLHGIDLDLRAVQLSALTLFLRARSLNPKCLFSDKNLACANVEQIIGGRFDEFIREAKFTHPIYERILREMVAILKDSETLGSLLRPEIDLARIIGEERGKAEKDKQFLLAFPGVTKEQFRTKEGIEEFFELISEQILRHLDNFARGSRSKGTNAGHFAAEAAKGLRFLRIVQERFDVVATNPPYLSRRNQSPAMAEFLDHKYPSTKSDLYAAFIQRCIELAAPHGKVAMITQQSFMFISSYERMRADLRERIAIEDMIHLGPKAFPAVTGEKVNTTAFVFRRELDAQRREENVGVYFRLVRERDSEAKRISFESALAALRAGQKHPLLILYFQRDFDAIPGKPWAYWVSVKLKQIYQKTFGRKIIFEWKRGLATSNNFRFIRFWWEIGFGECKIHNTPTDRMSHRKWFPFMKGGGGTKRWYVAQDSVVNWANGGAEIKTLGLESGKISSRPQNIDFYFLPGIVYSSITSSHFYARIMPQGFIFDQSCNALFPNSIDQLDFLGLLNSKIVEYCLSLNPTINVVKEDFDRIPYVQLGKDELGSYVKKAIKLSMAISSQEEFTYDFVRPLRSPEELVTQIEMLADHENEIGRKVSRLYGLTEEDMAAIDREIGGVPVPLEEDGEAEGNGEDEEGPTAEVMSPAEWAQTWISYAVGIVLSRFEIGTQGGLGCGDFSPEVVTAVKGLMSNNGILVNNPGQPLDLAARVFQAMETMLGAGEARTRVNTALGEGEPLDVLRGWFGRFTGQTDTSFWKYNFQLYRMRPVYWPLQSPKRGYTVWVFHERFTQDTLFRIRHDVELRLRLTEREISDQQPKAEGDRRARKELDRLLDFADDLREFSNRIKTISDRGYTPHIDDGVLLNAAPLHEILPSWPESKKAWQELEAGEYDWAQQAMEYWPERVKEKCKTNKSFAITHGLEALYREKTSTLKKKGRRNA